MDGHSRSILGQILGEGIVLVVLQVCNWIDIKKTWTKSEECQNLLIEETVLPLIEENLN